MQYYIRRVFLICVIILSPIPFSQNFTVSARPGESEVFIRFKVTQPTSDKLRVTMSGYRHKGAPWRFPVIRTDISGNEWSEWIDLSKWKWHGKVFRAGGIAEFPSLRLLVRDMGSKKTTAGCEFEVQIADGPSEKNVVISFTERSDGNEIAFLAPYPLRRNAEEFETGRQMAARHARWAKEILKNEPVKLDKFEIISNLWSRYDPFIVEKEALTLKSLGFNVVNGMDFATTKKLGLKAVGKAWMYRSDPEDVDQYWSNFVKNLVNKGLLTEKGKEDYQKKTVYYEIADEVSALNLNTTDKTRLDQWFRSYLSMKIKKKRFSKSINAIEYPTEDLFKDALPKNVSIEKRFLLYHAAKFGQWWSAKQMRRASDRIHETFPEIPTGTLLPSHGFLGNAWGPTKIGMSYRMLDIFEFADQHAVNQLSSEDWLGLNHMYGPEYTWTGGQTFGYLNALIRSSIKDKPILIRGYITNSDEKYLKLKAHSGLGQGMKSIFFWSYGPTFVSTENYWSDLKSHYEGIVKLNRSLQKTEDVLFPAKTVTDPVAILYSVSHDIWNNDRQAAFVEKRLLWHSLRHQHIQPDFLREEDIENGKLRDYKVLYITDWNLTRKASKTIDKWIKNGGILYLSAGAATRDEFNDPYLPSFAKKVWSKNSPEEFIHEKSTYNERTVLPKIKPLTTVRVRLNNRNFDLPVIGVRSNLNKKREPFATFIDGKPAGTILPYGRGKIIAVAFMPMLAYGKLANFRPTTLSERWEAEPREIIRKPLMFANLDPVIKADIPVVETSFLTGQTGAALVLANYTYRPVKSIDISIKTNRRFTKAFSAEGVPVEILSQSKGRLNIRTSLDWTDIITLQ